MLSTFAAAEPVKDGSSEETLSIIEEVQDMDGAETEHMKIFHKAEMGLKNLGTGKNLKHGARTLKKVKHAAGIKGGKHAYGLGHGIGLGVHGLGVKHLGGLTGAHGNAIKHSKNIGKVIGVQQGAKEAARAIKQSSKIVAKSTKSAAKSGGAALLVGGKGKRG